MAKQSFTSINVRGKTEELKIMHLFPAIKANKSVKLISLLLGLFHSLFKRLDRFIRYGSLR